MKCDTIVGFKDNGEPIIKPKKKHEIFSKANAEAERQNKKEGVFIKRVAYLCEQCNTYHVGTTYEMIENKKAKRGHIGVKVMRVKGKIDLSKIDVKKQINSVTPNRIRENKKPSLLEPKNWQVYFYNGVWSVEIKKKVVKLITPNGITKMIKIEKHFPNGANKEHVNRFIRMSNKSILY